MALSTAIVLYGLAILETASAVFDDRFALAMDTLHGLIGCYVFILTIIL
jgi:hypothetical protein